MIHEYTDNFGKTWLMANFTISDPTSTSPGDDCGLYSDANIAYLCGLSTSIPYLQPDEYVVNLGSDKVIIDNKNNTMFWHDLDDNNDVIDPDIIVIYDCNKNRNIAIIDKETSCKDLLDKFYKANETLNMDESAYSEFLYEWINNKVEAEIIPELVVGCSKEAEDVLSDHNFADDFQWSAYEYAKEQAGIEEAVDPVKRSLTIDIKALQPYFDEFCLKNSLSEGIRLSGIGG